MSETFEGHPVEWIKNRHALVTHAWVRGPGTGDGSVCGRTGLEADHQRDATERIRCAYCLRSVETEPLKASDGYSLARLVDWGGVDDLTDAAWEWISGQGFNIEIERLTINIEPPKGRVYHCILTPNPYRRGQRPLRVTGASMSELVERAVMCVHGHRAFVRAAEMIEGSR